MSLSTYKTHRKIYKPLALAVIMIISLGLTATALITTLSRPQAARYSNAFVTQWVDGRLITTITPDAIISSGATFHTIELALLDGIHSFAAEVSSTESFSFESHESALQVIQLPRSEAKTVDWNITDKTRSFTVVFFVETNLYTPIYFYKGFDAHHIHPQTLTEIPLPPDPEPPRGFEFSGWYFDTAFTQPFDGRPIFEGTVLYPRFAVITFTITYNLNGGTNHIDNPAMFTVESEVIILSAPTLAGHKFIGWFAYSDFGGEPITEIAQGTVGDVTLYARFEIKRFTVTFMIDGEVHKQVAIDWGTAFFLEVTDNA